jgi:hypothetical protein
MYLLIPFIMVQYVSVDTIYSGTICYKLYHNKWYQQIHIVPLLMVSPDTYYTIINGITRYILYIMVQYVSIDSPYNGTICIC